MLSQEFESKLTSVISQITYRPIDINERLQIVDCYLKLDVYNSRNFSIDRRNP